MEFALLGWPEDGPTLRLDHEQFSYAGKFVMSTTGKAVVRTGPATRSDPAESRYDSDVLAAVAFDADRTDATTLRCRYITVRRDCRGEGIGPRLLRFVSEHARQRGYDRLSIAVNNPYAYEAAYRAGFAYTGETTGLAELVCSYPPADASHKRYQDGLDRYRERNLTDAEEQFLATRDELPGTVPSPL
ncbi:GNAT family N-acetyltransferase [Salinibaculum salinum]|uniref:GNAT family N-acetyltransferase n=1 Tax=Salinibaculum salinum TaxID=3131996 RepID=UPI0030EF91FC